MLLTGETPENLEGKLVVCTVVGIVRRKQTREVLDRANPIKNDMTGFWQCPFCLKSDFRSLSLVRRQPSLLCVCPFQWPHPNLYLRVHAFVPYFKSSQCFHGCNDFFLPAKMYSLCCVCHPSQVWQHFDDGSCPGQGIGVRTRLESGLSGFVHIKNLSDKTVNAPEERVHVHNYT